MTRKEAIKEVVEAAEELIDKDDGQAFRRLLSAVQQWRRVRAETAEQMGLGGVR